jgi:hypothetical protein
VSQARPKREIALIWLPSGRKAKLADFAQGETFDDLEIAVVRALDAMPKGTLPWICCDKKFVLSPEDISMAHSQFKAGS